MYIAGRDKHFRVVMVVNVDKLQKMKPQPENMDLVALSVLMIEFMHKYCMVKGSIENMMLLIDCKNISVFSAPYKMIKQVLSTV
jgi:hypothetical protein